MKRMAMVGLAFGVMAVIGLPGSFGDAPPADAAKALEGIEAKLKDSPDEPMLHYRKCQYLFATGKEQASVEHASVAMEKFIQAKVDLPWIRLGSFETDEHRIDMHFNMSHKERAKVRDGIVRPYSFRVWTLGDEPNLVHKLDFELGCSDGKVVTAAIGEMVGGGHANYGIVSPDSDYATIKKKILEFLARQ